MTHPTQLRSDATSLADPSQALPSLPIGGVAQASRLGLPIVAILF